MHGDALKLILSFFVRTEVQHWDLIYSTVMLLPRKCRARFQCSPGLTPGNESRLYRFSRFSVNHFPRDVLHCHFMLIWLGENQIVSLFLRNASCKSTVATMTCSKNCSLINLFIVNNSRKERLASGNNLTEVEDFERNMNENSNHDKLLMIFSRCSRSQADFYSSLVHTQPVFSAKVITPDLKFGCAIS